MTAAPVTLLFTDLVDSTALLQRVGAEGGQRILHAHRHAPRGLGEPRGPRGEVARRRAPDDIRIGGRGGALRGDDGAAGPAAGFDEQRVAGRELSLERATDLALRVVDEELLALSAAEAREGGGAEGMADTPRRQGP
jgi:hypothetical protein